MGGLELAGRVDITAPAEDDVLDAAAAPEIAAPDGPSLPVPVADAARSLTSPEDVAAFQARFLRLLERRAAIYTMGDSTSVPKPVAADLLRSICFVLGIDPDDPVVPDTLLSVDLEDEYRCRLDEIGRRVEAAQVLWREVDATMPLIENIALRDTLKNIGDFFKWYDYRSMAHEIPCSIDYPLCHPVPTSLLGIDYIEEYLRRLMIEAEFLQRFEIEKIERVLTKASSDYIDLLINLYEPVAANAIGLALIGKKPHRLDISDDDRDAVAQRLETLGPAGRKRQLHEAAAKVLNVLSLDDSAAEEYLRDLVPDLLPRLAVALTYGNLRGVFAS